MRLRALFVCCLALALATGAAIAQDLRQKVDPWVIEKSSQGPTEFLVMLREQADLRGARDAADEDGEERVRRRRPAARWPRASRRRCSRCSTLAGWSTAPTGSPT